MPEQYVFTVAFDRDLEGDNDTEEQVDSEWQELVQEIAAAINDSGLPMLDSDRWEEFGAGHIFWGTQPECEALKRVLSGFPIFTEEERNLETGYYTTSDMTYFVSADGQIVGISKSDVVNQNRIVAKYNAIPLDAYKEPLIESELETLFQQFLTAEERSTARDASMAQQTQVSPDIQSRIAIQKEQIDSLEKQVQDLSHQLSSSQELVERKIDPADHETLRQKSANQSNQIAQFEEAVATLKTQVIELQDVAAKKIDPGVYEALEQQAHDKDFRNAELEQQLGHLADEISYLKVLVDRKIDPAEHETLRQKSANQSNQITQFEQAVANLSTQLNGLQDVAAKKIEPGVYEALQQQANEKDRRNAELEQQLDNFTDEISHLKALADRKIDPAEHEVLHQKSADQMNRIAQLENSVSQLNTQVEELQNLADRKIEPDEHNTLLLQTASQAEQIAELGQQVAELKNEVSRWQSIATEKIDRIEHEELLAQQNTKYLQEKATLQDALAKRKSYIPIWVAGIIMLCSLVIGIASTAALMGGSESALPVSQEIQS